MDSGNAAHEPTLWSAARLGGGLPKTASAAEGHSPSTDVRTPFEHDHDRLLFSTPVRRMADKTQVFPLDRNDGVRTRLTHSHEVANLARSLGNRLRRTHSSVFGSPQDGETATVMLAAAGLAHDLGNPPFGHQGEETIRRWFKHKAPTIFQPEGGEAVPEDLREDFLNFEGNAQTLRLVAKLQVSIGGYGLDLTAGTLAAMMKYTVPASSASPKGGNPAYKKPGFMASERAVMDWIGAQTGLKQGQRHPLAWLVEACDDVAYRVLDIEDAMKKSIVSPEDVLAHLKRTLKHSDGQGLVAGLELDFRKADGQENASEAREIKAGYLRARLIEMLMTSAAKAFLDRRDAIFANDHQVELLVVNPGRAEIYSQLKAFAKAHAYKHSAVLRVELEGAIAMSKLLDWFWIAVTSREDEARLDSPRSSAFASYVYEAIVSDNYRRIMEKPADGSNLPLRYRELQLLTDMVSGMTDGFVMKLFHELEPLAHA